MPDTVQQILVMETEGPTLRSEATGWSAEDPRGACPTGPVGLCGAMWASPGAHNTMPHRPWNDPYAYPDPLRALADGWKLLAPPTEDTLEGRASPVWEWWFVREVLNA